MESLLKDRPTAEGPPVEPKPAGKSPSVGGAFVGLGVFLNHRAEVESGAAGSVPETSAAPACSKPEVEVVEEGGVIVRLIVTCKCGERIEIDCRY